MGSPLGDALAAEMQRRGTTWKQKDLAAHFNIEQSTASRWLSGRSQIRSEYHEAVAEFLELSVERVAYLATLRTSADTSGTGTVRLTVARNDRPDDPDDEPEPPAAAGLTEYARAAASGMADLPPEDQQIVADLVASLRRKNGIDT